MKGYIRDTNRWKLSNKQQQRQQQNGDGDLQQKDSHAKANAKAGLGLFDQQGRRTRCDLFWAAQHGELKKIKFCLKRGANINWQQPSTGSTPAHVAAWVKREKALRYLEKKGADLDIKDKKGLTPLDVWDKMKDQQSDRDNKRKVKEIAKRKAALKKAQEEKQRNVAGLPVD